MRGSLASSTSSPERGAAVMEEQQMVRSPAPALWCWSAKGGTGTSTMAAAFAVRAAAALEKAGVDEGAAGGPVTLVDLRGDMNALLGMMSRGAGPVSGRDPWPAGAEAMDPAEVGRGVIAAAGERVGKCMMLVDLHDPAAGSVCDPASEKFPILLRAVCEASSVVVVDAGTDEADRASSIAETMPNVRPVMVVRNCYLSIRKAEARGASERSDVVLVEETQRSLGRRDVAAALNARGLHRVVWDARVARSVDAGTMVSMLAPSLRRMDLPEAFGSQLEFLAGLRIEADPPGLGL